MPNLLRYGLFRVGRRWCVASADDIRLDFATLSEAVAAADSLIRTHRAAGDACEVLVQDRSGRLVALPDDDPDALAKMAGAILAEGRAPPLVPRHPGDRPVLRE
jgi:hypothetical protein